MQCFLLTDAEPCTPIPTASFFGLDARRENADASHAEYRSACAFTKRITEKRIAARRCFAGVISPSPPPPPPNDLISAQQTLDAAHTRQIDGEASPYAPRARTETEEYVREIDTTILAANTMIDQLGHNNPILRSIMSTAVQQMRDSSLVAQESDESQPAVTDDGPRSAYGRRLMQRKFEYSPLLSDALVDHPIQSALKEGIPGVDVAACEALCEAINVDTNITNAQNCRAFAHKRADPFSLRDISGRCFLLRSAGACKAADFGAAMYTRQIESEELCHNPQPGFADELCIQLPTTRYDTVRSLTQLLTRLCCNLPYPPPPSPFGSQRVLTHSDATAIAAQTPRDAAPGSGGLPHPRTALEAGFLVALARREGIYSFWSASPDTTNGDVTMHWYAEGGTELVYRQGEFRCVLIASATSSTSSKMYAHLEPCE